MKGYKTFLTIAGSDCIGGAGIQADIKTAQSFGFYTTSVVSCVTAQNSQGMQAVVKVGDKMVRRQLECVFKDVRPDCVKIGMLADPDSVATVADMLRRFDHGPVVLDPVFGATKGMKHTKGSEMAKAVLRHMTDVVTVITPNRPELKLLAMAANADPVVASHLHSHGWEYMSKIVAEQGFPYLLVTGSDDALDRLYNDEGRLTEFQGETVATPNLHGTGCVFSSALACLLAEGATMEGAVAGAKQFLTDGLKEYADLKFGSGYGPANFFL